MTISVKGRRRLVVNGRKFVWYVAAEVDDCGIPTLTVASTDRRVMLRYQLPQSDDARHVIVIGPEFRALDDCGGRWRRFRSPQFGTFDSVTPRDVRALIEWALSKEPAPVEVDWTGRSLS